MVHMPPKPMPHSYFKAKAAEKEAKAKQRAVKKKAKEAKKDE